jgi:hydrogenase maturation factor HypF (carbamoyltransferase family)
LLENLRLKDESLNDEIRKHLETRGYDLTLYDDVPYYENPSFNRNWETHALAVSNTYADLIVALKQTEVRFLEEYAKTHFDEVGVTEKLKAARAELHQMAISAGYVD